MNISILLPFKENYSKKIAGAVSLFVNDTSNVSKFKKNIIVYGSTNRKDYLSRNYINLNPTRKFLQSSNKEYVKSFIEHTNFEKTDILEIHNRPSYIKQIKSHYRNKIFLYFHNDPITMNGSKSLSERRYILNNVDKIIFNSEWSRNRFFLDLNEKNLLLNKSIICYQSTNKTQINFKNKKKLSHLLVN